MDDMQKPVGVFDSGLGGLTVLRELRRRLPAEDFVYFADSRRAPYGPRTAEEVRTFSREITTWLLAQGAKCIVVACNTATASAIRSLREEFAVPFVGMEPPLKTAATLSQSGRIGVLATRGTLQGNHFNDTRARYASGLTVLTAEGDELVLLAERGELEGPEVERYIRTLIAPMLAAGMDQLVLGCTHYPLFRPVLERLLPAAVVIHDPAPAVARQTERLLGERTLLRPAGRAGHVRFHTSGDPAPLRLLAALIGEEAAGLLVHRDFPDSAGSEDRGLT